MPAKFRDSISHSRDAIRFTKPFHRHINTEQNGFKTALVEVPAEVGVSPSAFCHDDKHRDTNSTDTYKTFKTNNGNQKSHNSAQSSVIWTATYQFFYSITPFLSTLSSSSALLHHSPTLSVLHWNPRAAGTQRTSVSWSAAAGGQLHRPTLFSLFLWCVFPFLCFSLVTSSSPLWVSGSRVPGNSRWAFCYRPARAALIAFASAGGKRARVYPCKLLLRSCTLMKRAERLFKTRACTADLDTTSELWLGEVGEKSSKRH